MLLCAVALVIGEAVAGVLGVEFDEEAVAVDFGQHTGGGDGKAGGVSLDDSLLRAIPMDGVAAVDKEEIGEKVVGSGGDLLDGTAHSFKRGAADVDAVDGFNIDGGDGPGYCDGADFNIELDAFFFGEFLRVGEAMQAAALGKDNRGGDDRAEERAAAHFVEAGDALCTLLTSGFFKRPAANICHALSIESKTPSREG